MSDPSVSRPVRRVPVADHIWEAFELMAREMGTDRDGLVNQAMFMFARLNGYLGGSASGEHAPMLSSVASPIAAVRGSVLPPGADSNESTPAPAPAPSARRPQGQSPGAKPAGGEASFSPSKPRDSESELRKRNAEHAAPPPPVFSGDSSPKLDDDPVRREVAERVLETAAELERLIKGKQAAAADSAPRPDAAAGLPPPGVTGAEKFLYIMQEDGGLEKVVKDRFLIGRGKHCDLVINSGKVSREHAAITREGSDYYVEDLASSNGTWFNKQRIKRRKVEDGDEYFVCSDKIKCVIR